MTEEEFDLFVHIDKHHLSGEAANNLIRLICACSARTLQRAGTSTLVDSSVLPAMDYSAKSLKRKANETFSALVRVSSFFQSMPLCHDFLLVPSVVIQGGRDLFRIETCEIDLAQLPLRPRRADKITISCRHPIGAALSIVYDKFASGVNPLSVPVVHCAAPA